MEKIIQILEKYSANKYSILIVLFFFLSIIVIENDIFGQDYLNNTFGVGMIDMSFFSSVQDVIRYMTNLGESGREAYLLLSVLDFIIIISFALLQIMLIYKLSRALKFSNVNVVIYLLSLPIARSLFDMVENLAFIHTTITFPAVNQYIIQIACVFKGLKWLVFSSTAFIVVGMLLVILLKAGLKAPVFSKIRS